MIVWSNEAKQAYEEIIDDLLKKMAFVSCVWFRSENEWFIRQTPWKQTTLSTC